MLIKNQQLSIGLHYNFAKLKQSVFGLKSNVMHDIHFAMYITTGN